MENAHPDFFIKRKRLSKTKTVMIVKYNNLAVDMFIQEGNTFVFEKLYIRNHVKCCFKVTIHNNSINDFFKLNSTTFKVTGNKEHFGIYIQIPDGKLPMKNRNTIRQVSYELVVTGNNNAIYYDNSKHKRPHERCVIETSKTPIYVPDSVQWFASHPCQGGRTSPK